MVSDEQVVVVVVVVGVVVVVTNGVTADEIISDEQVRELYSNSRGNVDNRSQLTVKS